MSACAAGVSLAEPQRQSPLAILFLALGLARNIGIVQMFVAVGFVVSRSPSLILLAVGVFALSAIGLLVAALVWWRYTFVLDDGELVVRKGVISQDTLTVPLERVQSVSIKQKLLHRAFGLVQVSLDTAGTSTAEITIDAVNRAVAVALQDAASIHHREPTLPADHLAPDAAATGPGAEDPIHDELHERTVVHHNPRKLIGIALTRSPFTGWALAAPLLAFGDDFLDQFQINTPEVDLGLGFWLFWFIPVAALVILGVSEILNVVRVLLSEWNLTITATAVGLRRDAGLFSTTSLASSFPRIQRVVVAQGVLERFAHIRSTTLHTFGVGNFRVPGCTVEQALELRSLALEGSRGVTTLDRRVSSQEIVKAVRNSSIAMALLAIGLWFAIGWWAALVLLAVPAVGFSTRRQVRLRRWGITTDAIADRSEFLGWRSQEALLRKVNGVTVRQSLFERTRGLATVRLQMAGSSISIGMIPVTQAWAIRDRALYVAETDRRSPM